MGIKKKKRIIIPSIVAAIGLILIITGLIKGAVGDYNSYLNLQDFEAVVQKGSVYNLDIDVSLANINVICTNDVDEFEINADNITKNLIEYSVSNNTFRLRYETKKWYENIFLHGYKKANGTINLYVPANITLKDVEIKSKNGGVNVSYLTAERVFIDCGKEDNHITNLTCNYIEINNNGGNVNGVNINADDADLNLDSDTAVFSNFISNSVIINNDGDLKLSGIISGDSSIKSDGGDVYLTLYGNRADYGFNVIDGDVTVNENEVDFDKNAQYIFKIIGDVEFFVK